MDDELKHILFEIDQSINEIAKWNKRLGTKFNNYNTSIESRDNGDME